MPSSRLDRLFVLLETGSSSITRSAAAKQLGQVQKLHPHELNTLLTRTATYLRSSSWETRIAASEAVRAIVSNVPQWDPPGNHNNESVDEDDEKSSTLSTIGRLHFFNFDMSKVLANSTHLMASEGKEYDLTEDESGGVGCDFKEKLAKQRQILNARLGLDVAGSIGIDTDRFFTNEDLILTPSATTNTSEIVTEENSISVTRKPLRDIISSSELITTNNESGSFGLVTEGLSSREMNRAKRKARQVNKQKSRDPDETTSNGGCDGNEPDKKRPKIESTTPKTPNCHNNPAGTTGNVTIKEEFDTSSGLLDIPEVEENGDWPLEWFCDRLSQDLFSSNWEHRHGSATALREIITVHGKGAGRNANMTRQQQDENHQIWLEDLSIRLLCVLALDRFGDFVSDAVVAPVRETCAQSLCACLTLMAADRCQSAMKILLELVAHSEWETRHGGFLGLKYLLAVVKDDGLVDRLLPEAFPHILTGLQDPVDDVGAVAASSLIPVTGKLVELVPESLPTVISKLWDLLTDQDELTAACNSFMGLLAALLSLKQVQIALPRQQEQQELRDVVPKLWPFLFHNASSVRLATLQTLGTLIELKYGSRQWDCHLLQDSLRFLFQLVLIEAKFEVRKEAERIWILLVETSNLTDLLNAACPFISIWLYLSMQPTKLPLDVNFFIRATNRKKTNALESSSIHDYDSQVAPSNKFYIGGGETVALATRERNSVEVRCALARMLGLLSCYVIRPAPDIVYTLDMEKPVDCYEKVLLVHLNSKSALQRTMAGLVMAEWARLDRITVSCPVNVRQRLHECLNELVYFDEIASSFTRLTSETRDYLATLKHYKVPYITDSTVANESLVYTLEKIEELTGPRLAELLKKIKLKQKILENLEERRRSIHSSVIQTKTEQQSLSVSCLAALAGASVMFKSLPVKLTPVAKPLMESIRREQNENLQKLTAGYLATLLEQCRGRSPCPNDKIVVNLCTFLRCDPDFTPVISKSTGSDGNHNHNNYNGIVTLHNQQKSAEKAVFKRSGPGRPPTTPTPSNNMTELSFDDVTRDDDEQQQKLNQIQRRGAILALEEITRFFAEDLPEKLPKLWYSITGQLVELVDLTDFDPKSWYDRDEQSETLLWQLQVLEVTTPHVHPTLVPILKENSLNRLCLLLAHPYRAVRHLASRCLATFARLDSVGVMELIVATVIPKLDSVGNDDLLRQGGIEAVACIIDSLQFDIVPYVVLLIVPLLGRMSDPDRYVRSMGTLSFARLVQLMPLDGAIHEPPDFQLSRLYAKRDEERQFLKQLLSPATIPDHVLPIEITTTLRSYQQAGVNWLNFLNKYKLHGILCDDMGLGKTLQSIVMLAADHHVRDSSSKEIATSLVICPPTLTGHWVYEIDKFLGKAHYLRPLLYNGTPSEREKLRLRFKNYNLIVASYDIVRKDIAIFSQINWNYVVLDEGHVIKNGKTRTSQAIKSLTSNHRLILSGTPIQNNVLELWSLFDFLMPGFLGSEKEFTAKYSRPILASRDSKSSKRDQELGLLAMENLHRQVLPFLLRRVKEDVLDDLPPKITQDYYCDLSPLQEKLYEDFSKTQLHQNLFKSGGVVKLGNSHIFQALRYLQNVCNHPKLVLNESHPHYQEIVKNECRLDDISHSAKLPALKQLLQDCGIGTLNSESQTSATSSSSSGNSGSHGDLIINQHRALIFCQLKAMLDIIEQDLFKKHMPSVTYLRLDGAVPPNQRHQVVTRFNNDPSIDVLLLTTQVGGLGLNLTGADTVIFVEHDWNPMKDLQAMDRAHRIGQRKVVNVYRLITRATLEEKIMGLQKFKVQTVNTIITGNNSKLETMGTDQLLDLFTHNKSGGGVVGGTSSSCSSPGNHGNVGGVKNILETLPDLWDQKQYDDEYDLSQFISKLK